MDFDWFYNSTLLFCPFRLYHCGLWVFPQPSTPLHLSALRKVLWFRVTQVMTQGCHLEGPMARKGGTLWCSVTISPPSLGCLVLSHTSRARLGTQLQEEGLVPDGEEGPEGTRSSGMFLWAHGGLKLPATTEGFQGHWQREGEKCSVSELKWGAVHSLHLLPLTALQMSPLLRSLFTFLNFLLLKFCVTCGYKML